MITATGNTLLQKVLQFRPESGELAGKVYDLNFRVCSNPACDCGYGILDFYTGDDADSPVAQVETNVKERTLAMPAGSPALSGYVKERMEAGMEETDWENLQKAYYLFKNIMAERFDVESLDMAFPEELIDDPGAMQAYVDYLPAAEVFQVAIEGEKCALFDLYCINPACGCADTFLSWSKKDAEPAGFLYNYKTKEIDTKDFSVEMATAEDIISQCRHRHADFEEKLARRNRNLRSLFAKFLRKRKLMPPATVASTKKVGRNDPCPCGSGRKFKHCCGK